MTDNEPKKEAITWKEYSQSFTGWKKAPETRYEKFFDLLKGAVMFPLHYVHDNIVEPHQAKHRRVYYHKRFRRVVDVDQCYENDPTCEWEATQQMLRDRVEQEICRILKQRFDECVGFYGNDPMALNKENSGLAPEKCSEMREQYMDAQANWNCKYADMGYFVRARDVYMKQKHRLIWERRHGTIGSGHAPEYKYSVEKPKVWPRENYSYNIRYDNANISKPVRPEQWDHPNRPNTPRYED